MSDGKVKLCNAGDFRILVRNDKSGSEAWVYPYSQRNDKRLAKNTFVVEGTRDEWATAIACGQLKEVDAVKAAPPFPLPLDYADSLHSNPTVVLDSSIRSSAGAVENKEVGEGASDGETTDAIGATAGDGNDKEAVGRNNDSPPSPAAKDVKTRPPMRPRRP